jgi:pimeloyl-ACP methyl ester carboxylesterase
MKFLVLVALLLIGAPVAHAADIVSVTAADGWSVYGAKTRFGRDTGVPGGAAAIVEATETAEAWSSGATAAINAPVKAGETYTAVVWLRAPTNAKLSGLLLTNSSPYPTFANVEIIGAGDWKRLIVTGVAKADAEAGRDAVALHLGHAGGPVSLGPAVVVRGTPSVAELDALTKTYKPDRIAEDVTVTAPDGLKLAATLRIPAGKGPFPAVVMVGGSGPQVRGAFRILHARLLPVGVATLEYDKRGSGESGGPANERVAVLADDAHAMVRFLRSRPEIDPARIVVVGHSQGGMVAAQVAGGPDPPRGAVLLLSPAIPGREHTSDQVARSLVMSFPDRGSYAVQRAFADRLIAAAEGGGDQTAMRARVESVVAAGVKEGRIPHEVAEQITTALSDAVQLPAALERRPFEDLRRVRIPVLAVYGGKDVLVRPDENMPAARRALADNPHAEIVLLPTLNHALQVPWTDDPEEWRTRPAMDGAEVRELVAGWVEKTLGVRPR